MKRIGEIPFLILLGLSLLTAWPQARADVTVAATVDSNRINLGEGLTYTIQVDTNDSVTMGTPRLPDLEGFNLVNRSQSVAHRSTIVNGQFQLLQSYIFSFVLAPTRQGKITIGAAEVVVAGKAYKTQPITIDVLPAGQAPPQRPQAQQGPPDPFEDDPFFKDADDLFNQMLQRRGIPPLGGGGGGPAPGIRTQPVNPDEAFHIVVEVDKTEVFEGEQVTTNFFLLTPHQVRDIDTLKYPSLKGFWKEDIEVATRLNFQREIVNGVAYNKALLASYALFPIKAGESVVDSYKAKCTIVTAGNMLGLGQPYSFTKASQPVKIRVKPLPKDQQPADFSGAVGKFSLSAKTDHNTRFSVNQPFSIKLKLEGRGNAKPVELPALNLPQDLETYDTKSDTKFFRDGTSYKEWELFLIPRRQGEFTIPEISISSFDTQSGQFVTSKVEPITIRVGEGKAGDNIQGAPLKVTERAPEKPKELPPPLADFAQPPLLKPSHWLAVLGLAALSMLAALYLRARRELGWGEKKRALKDRTQRRLNEAAKHMNDYRKLGAEAINVMNLVLGELSKDGSADANFEKLILKTPPSLRREMESELREIVSYFESLAFAPEGLAQSMAAGSQEKFKQLEKALMKAIDLGEAQS